MKLKPNEAIIVKAKKGINEPFIKGIKWGEKYVIVCLEKGVHKDFIMRKNDKFKT